MEEKTLPSPYKCKYCYGQVYQDGRCKYHYKMNPYPENPFDIYWLRKAGLKNILREWCRPTELNYIEMQVNNGRTSN